MMRSAISALRKRRTEAAAPADGAARTEKPACSRWSKQKYIDVDRLPGREKPWWYRYGADLERAADAFLTV